MQPEGLPTLDRFFDRLYAPYHDMQLHMDELPENADDDVLMARDFEQGSKDLIIRQVLRGLRPRSGLAGRRLLDVGAHVGRLLWLAAQDGWSVEGLELNKKTAAFAHLRTGARITTSTLLDFAPSRQTAFDAITIIDVLEHIPHPLPVLRQIFELLVPGGKIAVKVPCGPGQLAKEWLRSRLQPSYEFTIARNMYHVSHFGPRSLRLSLERAGFEGVQFQPALPEFFRSSSFKGSIRAVPVNAVRWMHYWLCSIPIFRQSAILNLHLLAFATRPAERVG